MIIKNPFKHFPKLLFSLSLLWAVVLLMIGAWWIYLIFNFENILSRLDRIKIAKMIVWEGGSFVVLLLLLSISFLVLYIKDQAKTKSLQEFFASLTHELKTPLASIRLQGEVIYAILNQKNDPTLNKLISRLIEDTGKLEIEMDKILQLSRIQRGGELTLNPLKIIPFIKNLETKWANGLTISIESTDRDISIVADEFALSIIFKNLFENSRLHTESKNITIKLSLTHKTVIVSYHDHGKFKGDIKKLGTLFYKYDSKKGSGIGLYLCRKLMEKMRGHMSIKKELESEGLIFELHFKRSEEFHA